MVFYTINWIFGVVKTYILFLKRIYIAKKHEQKVYAICTNVSRLVQEKVVYIYIDECWVTVPKRFSPHLTAVSIEL